MIVFLLQFSFTFRRKLVNRRLIVVLGLLLLSGIVQAQGKEELEVTCFFGKREKLHLNVRQ